VRDATKARAYRALGHPVGRYGLVPVLLGLALAPSCVLGPILPHGVEYFFLAAVVASGWLGGWGPGLLAALLAPFVLDYFFLPPLHTLGIGHEAIPYVLPFLLSAPAGAWVGSTHAAAREARKLLGHSEAKFRRILTNLPDVAWTAEADGRVLYVSPKVEKVLGYSDREIRNRGTELLLERVHPEDRGRLQTAIEGLYRAGGTFDLEFRFCRKDRVWIWLHSRAVSYSLSGGVFADGVFSDISPRKEAEMELQAKSAFLEAQTNATIDGILVVNADGRQILRNRCFETMFLMPPELFDCADDAPTLRHFASLTKDPDGFVNRVLYLYTHPDAISRDEIELVNGMIVDRYSAPVRGSDGQYFGRIWTFRDITERRRSEDALRQLSTAVEQSPVSVVITDAQGDITYVNRKFSECTGYAAAEVLGKNPRILNSGYSPRGMYEELWRTIHDGREWRGEFRNRKKNGQLFWEAARVSPITDGDGTIRHFLAVKEDITERLVLESELRQAQKLEAIGQMAAGIAHEINTPIQFVADNLTFLEEACSSILPRLDLWRDDSRGADETKGAPCDLEFFLQEVPRAIEQSLEGARRVATIVHAMKEFSHPGLEDRRNFDLNQGIRSTITIARSEWKDVARMATDLDPELPPVSCYPGDINQVILNLIVNAAWAIRERPGRTEPGTIGVRTSCRGGFVEIAVSDNGVGIPVEIQERVFEPFFTTREVGSGSGQGLALAHSVIVRKHRGRIWFETQAGQGTTFYVQLPIDLGDEQAGARP